MTLIEYDQFLKDFDIHYREADLIIFGNILMNFYTKMENRH